MFVWSADQIRFLRDASRYTPFNGELAARAAAQFPEDGHICDAGCGLGYLSLTLAERCGHVTAADVSKEALAVLRENLAERQAGNVSVLEADVFALPPAAQFDGMVFCFFGGTADILRCVKAHCRGKAVLFKKNWATHRFTARETPLTRFTFLQTCAELAAAGVPFDSASFALEMGQPFRSLSDAERFFRLHERAPDLEAPDAEAIRARLTETGDAGFPYYLPAKRPVGMIVIDAREIPETINPNM